MMAMIHRFGPTLAALSLLACGAQPTPTQPNAATPVNAASGEDSAEPAPAEVPSVRSIDWQNHTYVLGEADGFEEMFRGTYAVKDGKLDTEYGGWVSFAPPSYGDADGDGGEDAVIVMTWSGGGSGQFSEALVYRLSADGSPAVIGTITGGDRGDGGLISVAVETAGEVNIERNLSESGDGACCPSKIVSEVWQWRGGTFKQDESRRSVRPRE